jgi:hypothetical protein
MWGMSSTQALIFVAAVVVMVAAPSRRVFAQTSDTGVEFAR